MKKILTNLMAATILLAPSLASASERNAEVATPIAVSKYADKSVSDKQFQLDRLSLSAFELDDDALDEVNGEIAPLLILAAEAFVTGVAGGAGYTLLDKIFK